MPLKGIIFDFDGVIVNSEPLHLRAYQDVLVNTPIELSKDDYFSRYLGYDDHGVFTTLSRDQYAPFDQAELEHLIESKGRRFAELVEDKPVNAVARAGSN